MPNPNLPINTKFNSYIGARYVPKFANKDLGYQWTNQRKYEPLEIVLYQGNSYTSTTFVPVGVDINNTTYWAETGNYNAQVEQYRQIVLSFDERISDNTEVLLSNIFHSIKEYGAMGDGVTDDTSAIQTALANHKYLYFPDGTYLVSEDLTLYKNCLLGSKQAIIQRKPNALTNYYVIDCSSGECALEGLTISGDKNFHTGEAGEWGHCLYLGGKNNYINNCHLINAWGDGAYIENDDNVISNCVIDNCSRNGISIVKGENIIVQNVIIKNTNRTNPMYAIDIEPNENVRVGAIIENIFSLQNANGTLQISLQHLTSQLAHIIANNIFSLNTGINNDNLDFGDIQFITANNSVIHNILISNFVSRGCRNLGAYLSNNANTNLQLDKVTFNNPQNSVVVWFAGGKAFRNILDIKIWYPSSAVTALYKNLNTNSQPLIVNTELGTITSSIISNDSTAGIYNLEVDVTNLTYAPKLYAPSAGS